jgi:Zn-dependent protease
MALAGPVANFTLACIAFFFLKVGLSTGYLLDPSNMGAEALLSFLNILFILNVILGVFNLLPMPPLDGWSVVGLVLPEDVSLKMIELSRTPGASFFGILVAWQIFPMLAGPVVQFAHRLLLM